MKEEKGIVKENLNICANYYLMKINTDSIARDSIPGNFVMVGINNGFDPLLKRPFGIHDIDENLMSLYYEVVGKGTKILSEKRSGDNIDIIGPLGNGFPELKNKNILMIAGGMGIAPIYYGIKKYSEKNEITLIYGARSKENMNLISELKELDIKNIHIYTNDGSLGEKGYVSTNLKNIIYDNKTDITVSCGPENMFVSLNKILKNEKTVDYVSMEALMGCGIGVCHSCVIETQDGYKKVCSDGPVFDMGDVKW